VGEAVGGLGGRARVGALEGIISIENACLLKKKHFCLTCIPALLYAV
jgi:hypothetical protein